MTMPYMDNNGGSSPKTAYAELFGIQKGVFFYILPGFVYLTKNWGLKLADKQDTTVHNFQ